MRSDTSALFSPHRDQSHVAALRSSRPGWVTTYSTNGDPRIRQYRRDIHESRRSLIAALVATELTADGSSRPRRATWGHRSDTIRLMAEDHASSITVHHH